jgi:hypothetical protein
LLDVTENELIGNVMEKYNIIKKANQQCLGTRWYNIYGAPEFKQGNAIANVKKIGNVLAKTAKNTLGKKDCLLTFLFCSLMFLFDFPTFSFSCCLWLCFSSLSFC